MFTNAFFSAAGAPVVPLAMNASRHWQSAYEVKRTLQRWQSRAFIWDAKREVGVSTAHALGRKLVESETPPASEAGLELCNRLERFGQPAVAKFSGPPSRPHRWLTQLFQLAPLAKEQIDRPVWRLLDPKPMDFVQWQHSKWRAGTESCPGSLAPIEICLPLGSTPGRILLPRAALPSLALLTRVLLMLRDSELHGDLVSYWVALQEASRLFCLAPPDSDLRCACPALPSYLADCFGRVQTAEPARWEQWQAALNAATRAWAHQVLMPSNSTAGPLR